jgi:hypothetical protein
MILHTVSACFLWKGGCGGVGEKGLQGILLLVFSREQEG